MMVCQNYREEYKDINKSVDETVEISNSLIEMKDH